MFEFFIALFGGGYWAAKLFADKSQSAYYDSWHEASQAKTETITAGQSLLDEIRMKLLHKTSRENLLNSIRDELIEVFGDAWKENFSFLADGEPPYWTMANPWWVAHQIYLSKKRKIGILSYSFALAGDEARRGIIIKTCQIIERNIQVAYPECKLVFVPAMKSCNKRTKRAIFWTELGMGKLQWKHKLPPDHVIPIRYLWNVEQSIEQDRIKAEEVFVNNILVMAIAFVIIAILILIVIGLAKLNTLITP